MQEVLSDFVGLDSIRIHKYHRTQPDAQDKSKIAVNPGIAASVAPLPALRRIPRDPLHALRFARLNSEHLVQRGRFEKRVSAKRPPIEISQHVMADLADAGAQETVRIVGMIVKTVRRITFLGPFSLFRADDSQRDTSSGGTSGLPPGKKGVGHGVPGKVDFTQKPSCVFHLQRLKDVGFTVGGKVATRQGLSSRPVP